MRIRPYEVEDREAVVRFALLAWAPVFASLEQTLSPELYQAWYPDWRVCQRQAVETACAELKAHTWVAEEDGRPVAFVAVKFHPDQMGEIHMVAVDPEYQQRGIGQALTDFALQAMKNAGASIAMVETGGDPGHAPARHTYERSGFQLFPVARYFKKL
jgi:ribosomal protein S18 acetylase RimI-like enzyme